MNLDSINVLSMKLEDAKTINEYIEMFDSFWNNNILLEDFKQENSYYFVAKTPENKIVGFFGIKKILDEVDIMNIAVKKEYRNLGIGSILLNYLISTCKQNNIKKINLEVNEKNQIAIRLYNKFNFQIVGKRKKYYNNCDDAILMQKKISDVL